jgi:xanthine dehydrogenase accessory factor
LSHEILLRQFKLGSEDKPFVLVGVLKTEGSTAIKAGNKALILPDGSIEGWIGGHCTEDEIVRTALECLQDGTTRFLNLSTCQGGRMDVYLEPYLPKRKLIIFGRVPIVGALASLAKSLNFSVTIVDKQATREKFPQADKVVPTLDEHESSGGQTFGVVATMGEFDVDHVMKLCSMNLLYVGVVAGKKRSIEIYNYLNSKELPKEQIQRVKAPAGIYIRAVTAEEIALSIMAEIVELARSQSSRDFREFSRKIPSKVPVMGENIAAKVLVDPVCGMTVESSSEFYSEKDGETIFFCCQSCKESFDANPQKYVLAKSS